MLTIADLGAQCTQRRALAFLSACETAKGSYEYLDEAIHLAAAMRFLGYRQVIATMWSIADSSAPVIADSVYTALTTAHPLAPAPDPARAAAALHHAVRALRETHRSRPHIWAPYIHLGS